MGQKLGAFLRVLGAGLSPQAFAAQTNQFAAEQAAERAKTAQIEEIGLKQGLATASILGKAYDAETDETKKSEIIQELKSLSEKVSQGDPRIAGAFKSAWGQGRFDVKDEGTEKSAVPFILPDGVTEVPAFQKDRGFTYRDKNDELVPLPFGSTKAATKQLQGTLPTTKSQKGKAKIAFTDATINLRQNMEAIDNLKSLVGNADTVLNTTGAVVKYVNSAFSQVKSLVKKSNPNYMDKDGRLNETEFNLSKENMTRFQKISLNASNIESQTLRLAFLTAKSLNPDGKISDADVRQSELILGDSGTKEERIDALSNLQDRMVSDYNISGEEWGKVFPSWKKFTPFKRKISGSEKLNNAKSEITNKFDSIFEN